MPYISLYCFCAIIVSMITPTSMAECPRTCECKWKSGKESVICPNANLTMVPPNLESGTQILDISENNIAVLKHEEFSKAGLLNLQKIFLTRCHLKSIEKYAFKNLMNLMELDLSYNALTLVPSHSFDSIPELRELRLNGNPIQVIFNNAFISIHQLVKLELSNCKIVSLEPKSFFGLESSLKWLKIDDNKLSEVEIATFTILKNLHSLELAGNPWNCSCKLKDLREWMQKQNVPYDIPPICASPQRIQDKSWKNLDLDEFACPPKIYATETKTRGVESNNITISCNVAAGIPLPHVKWMLRNRVIANLTGPAQMNNRKLYVVNQKGNTSELTINNAELQDAGVYTCVAENKAGKSEAVVTLTVTKKSLENKISTKALVVSVLLGVTFTFVCCLLATCVVSVRKQRLLKWHNAECRREDNYEKIEMKQKVCHRNLNGGVSREDGGLVTITKKNGDYCVVPGTDTDHENDEEEESTLEITTPGTSNERKWTNEESVTQNSKTVRIVDPCRDIEEDPRDNITRTYSSTCGTYKVITTSGAAIITTHTTAPSLVTQPNLNSIYTTASSIRQVPDVIGHSSYTKSVSSRTQSENGSANDINELFCTLPRKRDMVRYRSCDSQSPLLPESRYASDSSSDSFARRLSVEAQLRNPMASALGRRSNKQPGGSLLNLAREDRIANMNSTPLLDVRGLENRLSPHQQHQFQLDLQANATNPYNYHAAQLEKFLEEYRVLQNQLTKMKETCDSICQEQMRGNASPCIPPNSSSGGANLNNRVNSPNSNSIQNSVDFKNFENELTKYLMSRSPSTTKNFTSGALHN